MKAVLVSYASSLLPLLAIDGIWLAIMSKRFYTPHLSSLFTSSPQLLPAALFYLIYALGLALIIVLPSIRQNQDIWRIFLYGALFGLCAYGTYDLTNQATLTNWPVIVTIVDLLWGSFVTGTVCVLSSLLTRLLVT